MWFALFIFKHKLLMKMENTNIVFADLPKTLFFKALINSVSSSANVKCTSSLVCEEFSHVWETSHWIHSGMGCITTS